MMKPVVKKATPAAIAVLRQATKIAPLRMKASDGLLPSKAHILQNPNSDHNTGHAVDLTHDKLGGIDCNEIFEKLQADPRVDYLIFKGKIWSKQNGLRVYKGSNPHTKHIHISIKEEYAKDTSPWFRWLNKPVFKTADAARAFALRLKPLPKKKENK
jgi:hypothetical protein